MRRRICAKARLSWVSVVWTDGETETRATVFGRIDGTPTLENCVAQLVNVPDTVVNAQTYESGAEIKRISYTQAAVEVDVGSTVQLSTDITDGYTLSFESANAEIATVDGTGLVTGVAGGETAVIVTIKSGDEAVAAITVPVSVTAAAVIEAPENVTFNGSVISWDAVDGATSYRVTVTFGETPQTYTAEETQYDIADALTQEGAYTISVKAVADTAESLANELVLTAISTLNVFMTIDEAPDGNYILLDDIDFNGKSYQNSPVIGTLTGVLDGNGHALKNYSMVNSWSAFITRVSGTIRNLNVRPNSYTTHAASALFVDWLDGTLENIHLYVPSVTGNAISGTSNCAGLAVARRNAGSTLRNVTVVAVWTGVDSSGNNSDANTFVFGKRVDAEGEYTVTDCSAVLVNAPDAITKDTAATYVTYNQAAVTVAEGAAVQLSADIAEGYTLSFVSGNAETATVSETGLVTGVAEGDTAVTVTIKSGGETVATLSVAVSVTAAA